MATPMPPRLPASERLRRVGVSAWSIIGLLILLALTLWALLKIRVIFPPLLLAMLIIYLLNPIVSRLEHRGVSRVWGVLLSYVVVLGGITLLVIALTPFVSRQVDNFSQEWPHFRGQTITFLDKTAASLEKRTGLQIDTTQVDCLLGADATPTGPTHARCDELTQAFRRQITTRLGGIVRIGFSVIGIVFIFIVSAVLALYLLIDLPDIQSDLLHLVPEAQRDEVADLGSKVGRAIGGFFRGQLLVALLVGVLSAVGFALIGLPFWLIIGAIAGFFNLVPLVGPFIGGGLGFFIGSVTGGVQLGLKAALVELVVQQIDNHFISPNVMRRTVELHPVTVMLSIIAGGALAGFWGVLLVVPAVAVAKLILGHLWATRVLDLDVSPHGRAASGRPPSVVPVPDPGKGTDAEAAPAPEADAPPDGVVPEPAGSETGDDLPLSR
ncbi:MAG: AI-2E family transporter [Actinomycetota bacterium]|nr:AI-2E family transporter [Actinomycetota bacterium]